MMGFPIMAQWQLAYLPIEKIFSLFVGYLLCPAAFLGCENYIPKLTVYALYIISRLCTIHPEWYLDSYLSKYGKNWANTARD